MKRTCDFIEGISYDRRNHMIQIRFKASKDIHNKLAIKRHDYRSIVSSLRGAVNMLEMGEAIHGPYLKCLKKSLHNAQELEILISSILQLDERRLD